MMEYETQYYIGGRTKAEEYRKAVDCLYEFVLLIKKALPVFGPIKIYDRPAQA